MTTTARTKGKSMDKAKLIGPRTATIKTATVEVAGGTVTVRALSRAEVLDVRKLADDYPAFERRLLAHAMAEPELSEKDVMEWQKNSNATDIQDVVDVVMDICGLKERADKAAYKSAGE